jgi:outer membrane lipoprotein SlyB
MPQTSPDTFPRYEEEHPDVGSHDDNSCVEGTVAGGLLGGALGGVLSKKDNWIWAIPTGIVSGAMVGCQVDGG